MPSSRRPTAATARVISTTSGDSRVWPAWTTDSALEGAERQALDQVALHHGDEQDDRRQDPDGAGRRPRPVLDLLGAVLGDRHRQRLGVAAGEDEAVEELVVGEQ